jgi:phytoene synthase
MIASADLAACRESLANGSRTFLAASWLLPRTVRDPACALYAFCRLADDAVDQAAAGLAPDAVDALRERLDAIYAGAPMDHAADRALAAVVRDHVIARELPDALIEGFEWDAAGRRFETIEDVHGYAARVAGSVGAMMALLMGSRAPDELARACDLGVAMQLSNIARDVGEDARCGRLYLPLEWLRAAGIDADAWLDRPQFNGALSAVIMRLLEAADELYGRADAGIAKLPPVCRPGMYAARHLYAEIGHALARDGLDSVNQRVVVPWQRKARIMANAVFAATRAADPMSAAVLDEAKFLFDPDAACSLSAGAVPPDAAREPVRRPRLEERVVRLIDLFERLERRERMQGQAVNAS